GTKTLDSQKSHSNVPLNTSKPSYAKVLGKKESPQNHDEPVIVLEEGMLNFEDHYEYEKVEAFRESTTPQDLKKVRNDQTFHQVLEESVNKSSDVSKTAHADSMAGPVKQRNRAWGSEEKAVGKETLSFESGGYSFTWSNKHASKMSKLDRFLVSQGMLDLFPNLTGLILQCHLSDHRPILLKETHVDYGPTPFRLYHSWFLEDNFHSVIEDSWNNDALREETKIDRKVIQDSLIEIDHCLDKGNGIPNDLTKRANLFRDLKDIDHKDSIDLAQNSKIKWAVEGNENSKFFHGIVNKKKRHLAIKGILVDGECIENSNRVKSEFYSYYSNLFLAPAWDRSLFDVKFPRCLNSDQVFDLEDMVSNEEIKRAVWDCGSDKSPGLDGFTFEFLKKFWTIVGGDVTNAIKESFISSFFPKGCNSSFISLIPKVMDAKHLKYFMPISLIGYQYKIIGKILANRLSLVICDVAKKEQLLMFKVDFQKAFDSVRWDHLDEILGKGLRKGEPLSPFLFILVMESLHVSFQRLIDRDDATFIGKWSRSNVNVLMMMLHCFSLASGLKVNVHKSSIYGVGVRQADVQHMDENFGCISNNLPFTYLGVKVGANMMQLNSLSDVVKKVWNKYGDICFKEKFKRLINLELQKDANVASKLQDSNVASSFRRPPHSGIENSQFIELGQILSSVSLSSVSDRWSWTLHGLGDFSVKSAREEIDKHVLAVSSSQNRWSK
nr:hypothetical protein [Tanacetum cinerariifolium]